MKNIRKHLTRRNIYFVIIFTLLGLLALQIPVAQVEGSVAKFTFYDAFAPLAGAFIGSIPGIIAVFFTQLFNFFVQGAQIDDLGTIIRFFPMLFAVLYFAKKSKLNLVVPMLAIIAFVIHPIGREVWYYALFWTIPMLTYFLRDRLLFARALGATFSAHAVGGALWIWAFALPAPVWQGLIPIVAMERLLFALGIAASYVVVNNALYLLEKKRVLTLNFKIESKYLIPALKKL